MSAKPRGLTAGHPVVVTFLVLAVIAFMFFAAEVLKPLALAVLLSFALAPLSNIFESRGLPRFASVVLTVLLALAALGAFGFKVGDELNTLALNLDKDKLEHNIQSKLKFLHGKNTRAIDKLTSVGRDLGKLLDTPKPMRGTVPVQIVSEPSSTARIQSAVGPSLETVGVAMFVLVLVLFMLANREDLSDRIVRLFGRRQVGITTKTMDEVSQRISRYLGMFTIVNSTMGLTIGLGLWAIGVPLATLWGVLTALLRFIPYVGPTVAFALPFVFSVATFPGWREPLLVMGLFAIVETLANSYFEPVIYGKTTGVNALGLLVAAMFWTWLWGSLGLLLSTPLTVCLAVLGKYVPELNFCAIMLGEEDPLEPDARFYHRLLAMDQDGAEEIIQNELNQRPRAEVFDTILVPTLQRGERDRTQGDLDDREIAFIHRFIGELLDDLESTPEVDLKSLAPGAENEARDLAISTGETPRILGIIANDHADAIVLRMLDILLKPSGLELVILDEMVAPLKLADQIQDHEPDMVVLSHLPPYGSASARYLVRRVRARFAGLSIVVGRWGANGDTAALDTQLQKLGASSVVFHLADAREKILEVFANRSESGQVESPFVPAATEAPGSRG